MRISLSMKGVSSDSKLLIYSVCFSISFSSLVKLSVFCGVGTLFSEYTLSIHCFRIGYISLSCLGSGD